MTDEIIINVDWRIPIAVFICIDNDAIKSLLFFLNEMNKTDKEIFRRLCN